MIVLGPDEVNMPPDSPLLSPANFPVGFYYVRKCLHGMYPCFNDTLS